MPIARSLILALGLVGLSAATASAATVVNGGFNDGTGWTTANDAELGNPGGTADWTWNTPVVGSVVVTSTETVNPTEGTGFGITYAGADSFSQNVNIASAGDYVFSVNANAFTGRSSAGPGLTLVNGEFQFFAGALSSPIFEVVTTDGWDPFSWTATLPVGVLSIGLRNTKTAAYAIGYDEFSLTPKNGPGPSNIPVPAALPLLISAFAGLSFAARRRKTAV